MHLPTRLNKGHAIKIIKKDDGEFITINYLHLCHSHNKYHIVKIQST